MRGLPENRRSERCAYRPIVSASVAFWGGETFRGSDATSGEMLIVWEAGAGISVNSLAEPTSEEGTRNGAMLFAMEPAPAEPEAMSGDSDAISEVPVATFEVPEAMSDVPEPVGATISIRSAVRYLRRGSDADVVHLPTIFTD